MDSQIDQIRPIPGPPEVLKCDFPGCDREFETPQGLAVHRSRVHGVGGAARKQGKRRKRARKAAVLDRGALLALVLPGGVVRVDDLAALESWLEEAERIHRAAGA